MSSTTAEAPSSSSENPKKDTEENSESRLYQLVKNLTILERRESSLLELSKKRESFPQLAPVLWYSFGTIAALLQELVSCLERKLSKVYIVRLLFIRPYLHLR
jgi:CCR4-NOT transcription complex subunit 9